LNVSGQAEEEEDAHQTVVVELHLVVEVEAHMPE